MFRSALAVTEAHIRAARDAYAEGQQRAAGEMFAHPVSEVLFDMEPVFQQLGVTPFDDMLLDASASAINGDSVEDVSAKADAIIAKLHEVSESAPQNGDSAGVVAAGVVSDQIERAAQQYRLAMASDNYEPYLDGYGFYQTAQALFDSSKGEIAGESQAASDAMASVLADLASAYPTAARPESLDADVSALTAGSSRVILELP